MSNTARGRFESFFNGWLRRHHSLVEELRSGDCNPGNTDQQKLLIQQVFCHYKQYYEEKASAAKEDPYIFFSPPWLTSYERLMIWIGGFKPSMAFRVVNMTVDDLNAVQERMLQGIRAETRSGEKEMEHRMAVLEERMAGPPIAMLARRMGGPVDGKVPVMEHEIEAFTAEMAQVLESADVLRCSTVGKVVEVLRPDQAVRALAAAGELQLRLRGWSAERAAHDEANVATSTSSP